MAPPAPRSRRPLVLLALGAAIGLAVAGYGLLSAAPGDALPPRAVASVNGTPIYEDELARLLAGVESDTRQAVDADMRRHVLDRLIDEELLVQRGLELGLATSDRRVRADLVGAVIRSVVVEAEDREPTPEALRAFYTEERDFFAGPGRLHVRQVFLPVRDAADVARQQERAAEAAARLRAGEPFEQVRDALGEPPISPVPDAPLPPTKLREYLGPAALQAARQLAPGQVSDPVRSGIGFHVLVAVDVEPPAAPPLEAIRDTVRAEWRRREGERALRAYLDELRDRAELHVAGRGP